MSYLPKDMLDIDYDLNASGKGVSENKHPELIAD